MIFDLEAEFSDKQKITTTTVSDKTYDSGPVSYVVGIGTRRRINRDMGAGRANNLRIQVVENFSGLNNLTVVMENSDDSTFSSDVHTVSSSGAIPVTDLKAGLVITPNYVPSGVTRRYLRLKYIVSGTATSGAISAGFVAGRQTNS